MPLFSGAVSTQSEMQAQRHKAGEHISEEGNSFLDGFWNGPELE